MNATDMIAMLAAVRACGADHWIARCPAHEDKSPSLTIRQTPDRILIYCWAGCSAQEICAALDLRLSDLFRDSARHRVSLTTNRRQVAVERLESWRQSELQRLAEELRWRDTLRIVLTRVVAQGIVAEDTAWPALGTIYHRYCELEDRFERLLRNQNPVELWREAAAL